MIYTDIVVEHQYSIAKDYPKAFFLWRLLQLHFHDLVLLFHQSSNKILVVTGFAIAENWSGANGDESKVTLGRQERNFS